MNHTFRLSECQATALTVALLTLLVWQRAIAQDYVPFTGEKTVWHGFDRYDFLLDETTLALKPAPAGTPNDASIKSQRRCMVVVPKDRAAGNPWSWRGCYWDHEPQTEVALLQRGFHIAYITANAELKPDEKWDAWYGFLQQHGLSAKPAFIGMSRGGMYAYTWATRNPSKVSCIYADNPACTPESIGKLADLATNDVPLMHVCGSIDPLLGTNTAVIESIYSQLGGRISVMVKEGEGHHPHSLHDSKRIADFIAGSAREVPGHVLPKYLPAKFTRSWYYSGQSQFREFPAEKLFVTCRGPLFSECYARYTFELSGVEGKVRVIAPRTPAMGNPWVFRSDYVGPDAGIDQALLAAGFHIVTGPVPYNANGPSLAHWNVVYKHLVESGLSTKPTMEGFGASAGDAYAFAIANPDKVSSIYGVNPILRSQMATGPIVDHLDALAKVGVPILHVVGSLDPLIDANTKALQARFTALGGTITVLVKDGEGHQLASPRDLSAEVKFIIGKQSPALHVYRQPFGQLPDGTAVDQYYFSNGRGLEASILTLGATLHTVSVPDRDGKPAIITLHHDSVDARLKDAWATGATVGRFANRIANASIILDGKPFPLEANAGKHQIHGGKVGGFQWQVWRAEPIQTADVAGVKLHLTSPDGQGGFPGNLQVDICYTLNAKDELTMDYTATTDQATFVNLTNHAYWNLGGVGVGDVSRHLLQIRGQQCLEVDEDLIPTGKLLPTQDTPADFSSPRAIGSRLAEVPKKHYDQCYVLDPAQADGPLRLAARVEDPQSGRVMEVRTTQPGLQLFTGHPQGFCLEAQHFPDSPHQPKFPSTLLRPGETFHEVTVHRFLVRH